MQTPPAEVGMSVDEVDTPALVVELNAFERNLTRMAQAVEKAGVKLRPHAKTHKCATIAQRQMEAGAVGVCCQKVSEAQALVDAGVNDILISNEVIGRAKLERLARLSRRASIGVCVDHPQGVSELAHAAANEDADIWVLVEVDVGAERCGVDDPKLALELAQQIESARGLRFAGLQAYQGRAQHKRSFHERKQAIDTAVVRVREVIAELAQAGLHCEIIAGAGTGTFRFEAASGVYNELQAGSYIFMDRDYSLNLDEQGEASHEFEHSLFVLATVMSVAKANTLIVDAGLKAMSFEMGPPGVHLPGGGEYARPSDEHGRIDVRSSNAPPSLGGKVWLIPGHCDPTVNLHDWIVAVRDSVVEAVWPVEARGCVY